MPSSRNKKYTFNFPTPEDNQIPRSSTLLYRGRVVSNEDPIGGNRIKVRIKGVDDKIVRDENLPFCNPFLPKFLNVVPKVGETAKIIVYDINNNKHQREYIGPLISSQEKFPKDPHFYSSQSTRPEGYRRSTENVQNLPKAQGAYPEKEEIAYHGRDNSDLVFKEKEVRIRAGKFKIDDRKELNDVNPGYMNIKLTEDGNKSFINLSANKINLISHDGTPNVSPIIGDDEQEDVEEKLHPLVYGDDLIEFLKLVKDFVANHVHAYHGLGPNAGTGSYRKIQEFDLESIISENIRTN